MNNYFAKMIYLAAAKVRNPSIPQIYREIKESESLSRKELMSLQFKKLKNFLIFANKHSSFYQNYFSSHGFFPEKMTTASELDKLPPLEKSDLIKYNAEIHTQYNFKKIRKAITSGTSGVALSFMRNEEWDSANRAGVMRGYAWHGVDVWERNGYLWGYNLDSTQSRKVKLLDSLQNRIRLFRFDKEEIEEFAKSARDATYLGGYSSMIYQIAKKVNEQSLKFNKIKMVKGTSEMILDSYQEEVIKAFGHKMISEYGSAETGLIGFECPEGSIHLNMDSVYVELSDEKEIIVTNLRSHSFPIIRYKLGDVVTLSDEVCTCGRNSLLIKEIVGRKGKNIVGKNEEYPGFTFYYVFKNLALEDGILLNYKAYQKTKGEVIISLEAKRDNLVSEKLYKHLLQYFGDDIDFKICFENSFDSKKKKQQSFTSELY